MYALRHLACIVPLAALLARAAAGVIRPRASPGCGTSHSFAGESREFSFESSGGTRTYRIHLPSGYDVNDAYPLLIAYHGSGGDPAGFEETTQMSDESINPNMIVVYPAGIDGNWQGPTYATPGVSDEAFTTDLVRRVKNNYCVDQARVYAAGHSNGGGFVGTLACSPDHGGQFAAFAPVSAALYTDVVGDEQCSPARSPIPMMETHGTADDVIPYKGGEGRGGPLPAIPEWLSRWSARNHCAGSRAVALGNGVTDERWTCAGDDGLLRHIRMEGHGHDYPASGDAQLSITPLIIDFLLSHRK